MSLVCGSDFLFLLYRWGVVGVVYDSEYDLGEYNSMEVGVGVGISAGSAHWDSDDVLSGASDEVVGVDEEVGVGVDAEAGKIGVVVDVSVGISAGSVHFDSDNVLGVYGGASGERVSVDEEVDVKVGSGSR